MNKRITVKALGKKNPNQLFALGDRREEFYFINPPTDKAAKTFFDDLYKKITAGEQVEVEANVNGRNAQLIIPSKLETTVKATEQLPVPSSQYDDSVQAKIVQVDLYSIIHTAKEAQFANYGKHCQWSYDAKMKALEQGKPQEKLQNDRIAREVVRILLQVGHPIHINGSDCEFRYGGGVIFPKTSNKEVQERVFGLMNEAGLLDFSFQCHAPNSYAFESEFIVRPWDINPSYMESRFTANNTLRELITKMLKPFEAEKPLYVLPQER